MLEENGIWTPARICNAISAAAVKYDVPRNFFTRLIWVESRFDRNALSPVGAQGIAQFMPATARERGLADPYDPEQAIPASAALLAHEKSTFGNFGLAAAAYNAGPGRVARFRDGRSGLPFETLDYVVALTGKGAATFLKPGARVEDFDLEPGKDFFTACRALPVRKTRFRNDLSVEVQRKPWGVDVAGNFKRAVALRNWEKVRARLGTVVGDTRPELVRTRSPLGRARTWTVRLGAETRTDAIDLCKRIRRRGRILSGEEEPLACARRHEAGQRH